MPNEIIKSIEQYLDSGKWIIVVIGIVGFFLKIIAKYIQKKLDELEKLKDEVKGIANKVEIYDMKAEGRGSFTSTIEDLNVRMRVLEELERRKNNIPIDFPERRRAKDDDKI
jgi:hypothetical protein